MIVAAFLGLAVGLVFAGFVSFLLAVLKPESVRDAKRAKLVSIIALGVGLIAAGIAMSLGK